MGDIGLVDQIAMACGIVGAITGLTGAVFGLIGYRRTNALKALDLRLEVRRTENTMRQEINQLVPVMEHSKRSRKALSAAQGRYQSGAMSAWLGEWESDLAAARTVESDAGLLDVEHATLTESQLEDRLVKLHRTQLQIRQLLKKYQDGLAEDDVGREHVRLDNAQRTQARLDGKL